MKTKTIVFAFLFVLFAVQASAQVTAYYQPTPYPDGVTNGIHIWDGWLNNSYNQTFVMDDKLQIGGWGDVYLTFMKFDLTGLPVNPTSTTLYFMSYDRGDGSTQTPFNVCLPSADWSTSMTWTWMANNLTFSCSGWLTPPAAPSWWGLGITSWYNNWRSTPSSNHGIMLSPQYNNNRFDMLRSSRYADFQSDPYADGRRPMLSFTFNPTLELKMPLPGNHEWLVTTEPGGYSCMDDYDVYHTDVYSPGNYFSIDFSWRNYADPGATVYDDPDDDIPILAAAGGKVVFAGGGDNPGDFNGYYVVIDHDYDGNLDTGFSTRYLHMKYWPSVSENTNVSQGALIGYMGTTGRYPNGDPVSTGVHLHFGVRYGNGNPGSSSGYSTVSELSKVVMDGWILRSFQTECGGSPLDWIRFYRSQNTAY